MEKKNNRKEIFDCRPILIIANSSWYLNHYRYLLINEVNKSNKLITMAPVDASSNKLSKFSIFIPWKIQRSKDASAISLFVSFLRLLLLVRAIKPKLIHSHTLKTNFLTSAVAAVYGIPCVLSFAGLGRLSTKEGLKIKIFRSLLRLILYFSIHKRESRLSWKKNLDRSYLIFQNPIDQAFFHKSVSIQNLNIEKIIPGSGLPQRYLNKNINSKPNSWKSYSLKNNFNKKSITFIYCARLIKSKGIYTFLEILKELNFCNGIIYGSIDPSSNDSLSEKDINQILKSFKNISFEGNVKDPLLNCNFEYPVFINPSEYGEGVSRTILEALGMRIPVICSKNVLSGIFEKEHVFYAKNNLLNEYCQLVDQLINEYTSEILHQKIENAYQFVYSNYTEEITVKKTISLYSELLNKNNSSYLIDKETSKNTFWLAQ